MVGTTHLNFVEQEDPFTITAYGKVHITADNLAAITGTVDVGANSNLVVTGKMTFAYDGHLGAIGTGGTITNNGLISIARGDISARVNGHGTLELHNYHDGTGWQTISGAIGAGQDVVLVAHNHETRTELVDPKTFKASLEIADQSPGEAFSNFLDVDGIHASRLDIRGDMLRLYGAGNKPLWQVHESMPVGSSASMTDTATGTEIVFTPPSHQLVG